MRKSNQKGLYFTGTREIFDDIPGDETIVRLYKQEGNVFGTVRIKQKTSGQERIYGYLLDATGSQKVDTLVFDYSGNGEFRELKIGVKLLTNGWTTHFYEGKK